jgi:oligopeptide/dipeptide ABC transporter ATP-binding protein
LSSLLEKFGEDNMSLPILLGERLSVEFINYKGLFQRKKTTITALKNVSLRIGRSDTVVVVGESGSGKTTLAKCLAGLMDPTQGYVSYMGKDIRRLSGKEFFEYRAGVQMVFQDPFSSLNPRWDVFTSVAAPIKYLRKEINQDIIRKKVSELITEVGLDLNEIQGKLPHQLSGGQLQRISIARALASDPKVLIADEPVTMLDASKRISVLNLLLDLQREHSMSLLFVTHDLAAAKVMGGKIVVMYHGRIIESGDTLQIIAKPMHPYTRLLVDLAPRLEAGGSARNGHDIPERPYKGDAVKSGCSFANRCKFATDICYKIEPSLEVNLGSRLVACHNPLTTS